MQPEGVAGTNQERTFIAVKPDGVQRGIVGNIISRFENKGFKLVALKVITPSKEQAEGHYADLSKKPFFGGLVNFFSSGPICAMVWEGLNAVKTGRVLLGATNPADSLPGTIRGDLCIDVGRNICHGSDSPDSAKHEINFWFTAPEVYTYGSCQSSWVYEKPPSCEAKEDVEQETEKVSDEVSGKYGTNSERTFIAIKPDGVQRGKVGNIISRFEAKGFKISAMKMTWASKKKASEHYADLSKKPFFGGLVDYFTMGPIVAMVWEGKEAVKTGRVLLGATNPADSLPGTIRGDLCIHVGRNVCHGSDGEESAAKEIKHWFNNKPDQVNDYTSCSSTWIYEK